MGRGSAAGACTAPVAVQQIREGYISAAVCARWSWPLPPPALQLYTLVTQHGLLRSAAEALVAKCGPRPLSLHCQPPTSC